MAGVLTGAGLDARLLKAAGHEVSSFLDENGLLDTARLAETVRTVVAEFNVTPRRAVKPNPQQGKPSGEPPTATWGKLLGDAARGG